MKTIQELYAQTRDQITGLANELMAETYRQPQACKQDLLAADNLLDQLEQGGEKLAMYARLCLALGSCFLRKDKTGVIDGIDHLRSQGLTEGEIQQAVGHYVSVLNEQDLPYGRRLLQLGSYLHCVDLLAELQVTRELCQAAETF